MKRLRVAVGIIRNFEQQVLVGQRTVRDEYFEKWEFPGGKIEENESVEEALHRELHEELGIDVSNTKALLEIEHDYPDRSVHLYVCEVLQYAGNVAGREGQALRWVNLDDLPCLDLLAGNKDIVVKLKDLEQT